MKFIFCFLHSCLFISYSLFAQNFRSNCPVFPIENTQVLPDGSKLTLTAVGSEMTSYLETLNGLTVLKNKDGFFEYAIQNELGDLVGSGILAKNENSSLQKNLTPHLRYSPQQLQILEAAFNQQNVGLGKKASGKPFPPKGNRKVLTLLIQYPDLNATIAKSNFDSLMVKPYNNGTGSFKDFYLKTSFNQLNLDVDVFGWFNAPSGYMNYAKSNANYNSNVAALIKRAVLAADSAGVDFSQYDNDKDGYVDGIIVLHAGIGAEEQSAPSPNNYIWSHRSNLEYSVGSVSVDGVLVNSYGCFPEKRYNGGSYSQVGIGVICHEFGHLLDLPDLYSTSYNGEGSGNYAIMAGGPWLNNERTPCMNEAWSRIQLGWMQSVLINTVGTYTIPKALVDSNFAFRINTPVSNEYLLLENRQKKGFDLYLPSKGMAVWHINSNKAKLLSLSGSNNVNNDTSNLGVGLIQADGKRDLETGANRGDAGDLFPGSTNNRNLTPTSKPSTVLYYKVGGVKQASNITISNITQNADSSITFTIGNKPSAGFDASSLTGCAPLRVDFSNTSAFVSNFLWRFSDGSTSTVKNQTKIYDSAGSYNITLTIFDSLNNPIDSITQTVVVDPSPVAKLNITRGDSNTFNLTNLSSNFLYVVWKFGTNQTSTANDPVYTLTKPGKLPVQLIAYSQNGCSDTAFSEIDYWPVGFKEFGSLTNIYNYPNPFTDKIDLQIQISKREQISITISDIKGSKIENLFEGSVEAGDTYLSLTPHIENPGVYLLEVRGSNFNKILRVLHP